MIVPKKWGQGQLFAFSACDGKSCAGDDFVGVLSGDRLGIKFFSKIKRELAIVNLEKISPEPEIVTGDCITFNTKSGKLNIVYADTHLIVGSCPSPSHPIVFVEDEYCKEIVDNVEVHNTNDGEYTAFCKDDNKFCFAYGKTKAEVLSNIEKGMDKDVEEEKNKKLCIYERFHLDENDKYASLYAKCISVMKTQLYSPEGFFKRIWSTPDRLPHQNCWLWDSVFHAIGHRNMDVSLAQNLILAIFDYQKEDGFIPHMATPTFTSSITQPPVIAWGAYKVYEKSNDKEFLKKVFECNKKFLIWCQNNRRDTNDELYTWLTTDDVNCRCDESGMDNSPRFDSNTRLWAIDFSCFMANETRFMAKIATELGDIESAGYFADWNSKIKSAVNENLWCVEDEFYYDYDTVNKTFSKIQSVASFLPLFAGICDDEKANSLFKHLTNPETFYTEFPIPCISKKDKTFGTDMWRGPVWLNYNYMISEGLRAFGFTDLAGEIKEKTISAVDLWYSRTGTIYEFYDSENHKAPSCMNRKGNVYEPYDFMVKYQSIRDYGWSCTITFDWLHNK